MKTCSLLLFVCLFISRISLAQFNVSAGVKGGGAISTLIRGTLPKNEFRYIPGLYAGVFGNVSFGKFFFQPEFLYSLRGYNYKHYDRNVRFGFISLPLLIGFKPVKKLSIMVGPELGHRISTPSDYSLYSGEKLLPSRYQNTMDLDAGIAWSITPKLNIEGRFMYGITYMHEVRTYRPIYPDRVRYASSEDGGSKVFQLGVTYKLFKLK
jgi:hypothetical protein